MKQLSGFKHDNFLQGNANSVSKARQWSQSLKAEKLVATGFFLLAVLSLFMAYRVSELIFAELLKATALILLLFTFKSLTKPRPSGSR